ncbi:39S ribosomal protein L10, mitochondrial [Erpetoichthys calabaricus]|uniref:Large ribosomal subunit protein uL10m n=1 Tax=Erpetoichthys calabaricus TaxID=27687 RepID=A0A8C4TL03_ERPCA|nr:39S ribosomal protein L10, mitochondrial [Erpetoichthys calabaricus]
MRGGLLQESLASGRMMAATLSCGVSLLRGWLPSVRNVRHGSKAVTRHRKPMHFLKQKLMAVTEYIPPKPVIPDRCLKPLPKRNQEESGLVRILKREVDMMFQNNKMIAVFQNNSSSSEDLLLIKYRLQKHDITVKFFPNQVMRSFLSTSKYINMLPLFVGHNVLLVSREPKTKEMLKVVKNTPQISLLGACIEDTILSHKGVHDYSRLPSVAVIQGQVVGGLTQMTSQTRDLIRHNPLYLSMLLKRYVDQPNNGKEGTEGAEEIEKKQTEPS